MSRKRTKEEDQDSASPVHHKNKKQRVESSESSFSSQSSEDDFMDVEEGSSSFSSSGSEEEEQFSSSSSSESEEKFSSSSRSNSSDHDKPKKNSIFKWQITPQPVATSIEDALTNLVPIRLNSGFEIYAHQKDFLSFALKRMKMIRFESKPDDQYRVTEAPNCNVQGGILVAEKGMGKSFMMLLMGFTFKRINGPWILFESLTLFKEIHNCLYKFFPLEYHTKVLFFHPSYINTHDYKNMTHKKLKEFTIIVVTLESYSTMVHDYGFDEEAAQYAPLSDGTMKAMGMKQCTHNQAIGREKFQYKGTSALMALSFDGILIDESHMIRNANTNRFNALYTVARLFNFLFTGDLLINSSNDLFSQLRILGYKGSLSIRDWEDNVNYYKKRDALIEDRNRTTDRTDATSPIKVMSIDKDAPYLKPPALHREEVMIDFTHQIEIITNLVMKKIMESLIKAATDNKINKRYVFSFFTFQNLTKIAPFLISTKSKRKNYKVRIFSEEGNNAKLTNKTIIGDEAFNSYFTPEMIKSIADEIQLMNPQSKTELTMSTVVAPLENGATEEEIIDFGNSILERLAPNLMSDMISNEEGPAGMQSTTMQWIVNKVRELPQDTKIIIGSNYTTAVDLITKTLHKYLPNIHIVQLDGSVRGKHRNEIINTFQNDPSCRIIVMNNKIGSHGLNLTQATVVIDADGWYNDAQGDQLICRAWRPGQTQKVLAYQLFRRNTIDEHILTLRKLKRENIEDFWSHETGTDTPNISGGNSLARKKKNLQKKNNQNLDFDTIKRININDKKLPPPPRPLPSLTATPPPPPPLPTQAINPFVQRQVVNNNQQVSFNLWKNFFRPAPPPMKQ